MSQCLISGQVIFNVDEDDEVDMDRLHVSQITNATLTHLTPENTTYPDLTDANNAGGIDKINLEQQRSLEVLLVARLRTIQGVVTFIFLYSFTDI